MRGNNSLSSSLMRTKNMRTATASRMPITPQTIQCGKNDPRILKDGAREHPAANRDRSGSYAPAEEARLTPPRGAPTILDNVGSKVHGPFVCSRSPV